MAEHGVAEATEAQPKPKRSLVKIALLGLNILLFLAGVGSLVWGKFAPKPQAPESVQTQEPHDGSKDESPSSAAKSHSEVAAKKPENHGGSAKGGHGGGTKAGHGVEASKGGHGGSAKGGHGGGDAKGGNSDSMLIPLPPFIVNLSGDNGQRYLRLVAQVEARGDSAKTELEAHLPEVRNRLIFLLTSKTFSDIGSVQGKYDLQADITKNINETLDGPFIKRTYFTEFIVQ